MKRYIHAANDGKKSTFAEMFKSADRFDGVTTDDIEEAAQWSLPDGSKIFVESLGRDLCFDVFGVDSDDILKAYVCVDNGVDGGKSFDDIDDAVKNGAKTLEDVFDMWENGLGGSPFDSEYFPE